MSHYWVLVYKRVSGNVFSLFEKVPVPSGIGYDMNGDFPVGVSGRGNVEGDLAVAHSFALTLINGLVRNSGAKCTRRSVSVKGPVPMKIFSSYYCIAALRNGLEEYLLLVALTPFPPARLNVSVKTHKIEISRVESKLELQGQGSASEHSPGPS